MDAIILAGGLGKRLRPAVQNLPKPLAPIAGVPFLRYLLNYWSQRGVERFILSVGYKKELIQKEIGNSFHGSKVVYSCEDSPLGTGGALRKACSLSLGAAPCLVLNGDTFVEVDLAQLKRFHEERRSQLSIVLTKRADEKRSGRVDLKGDQILSLAYGSGAVKEPMANAGVYLLDPKLFELYPADSAEFSFENDVIPHWIKDGTKIYGFKATGLFIDIGVPEDYERSQTELAKFKPQEIELRRSS